MNGKRMLLTAAMVGLSTGLLAPQAMAQAAGDIEEGTDQSTETQSEIEDSPQMPGVRTPPDDVNNGATVGGDDTLRDDDAQDVIHDNGPDDDADTADAPPE